MEIDLFKKALDAAPILVIAIAPALLVVYWTLRFLREERSSDGQKIAALTAEVSKLGTAVAEFGGYVRGLTEKDE